MSVAVVTTGQPPDYSASDVAKVRSEAERAHAVLGVRETLWLDLPAARLVGDAASRAECRAARSRRSAPSPRLCWCPLSGDIHVDHQLIFQSAMVAARPHQASISRDDPRLRDAVGDQLECALPDARLPSQRLHRHHRYAGPEVGGHAGMLARSCGQPPRTIDRGAQGAGDAARGHGAPPGRGSLRACADVIHS